MGEGMGGGVGREVSTEQMSTKLVFRRSRKSKVRKQTRKEGETLLNVCRCNESRRWAFGVRYRATAKGFRDLQERNQI